jgi:hypothetical protein
VPLYGATWPIEEMPRDDVARFCLAAPRVGYSASRAKILESRPPPVDLPVVELQGRTEGNANSFFGNVDEDFGESFRQMGDSSMVFNEDFSEIEDMFYSTGWFGQMGGMNRCSNTVCNCIKYCFRLAPAQFW